MHKKEYKIKWTTSNREYRVAIYQIYRMGCPICAKRMKGGFKGYKRWRDCDDIGGRDSIRNWKYYREHQYR